MGSYEELYITMVLRILLGRSLKMSVIVVTIRNNNKKITIEKKQVEITMGNKIYKTNIKCIKSGNKYRASDKI